jgi:histidinol-phosphate aminotransferase
MLSRRSFVRTLGDGAAASAVAPLIHGRGLEALATAPTGEAAAASSLIKLDSNENPNGPARAAMEAIAKGMREASLYPRDRVAALRDAVAATHGLANDGVVLGCGSGEILRMAVLAWCGPDRPLVTAVPSFETPVTTAALIKAPVRGVPVTGDLRLDLDAMAVAARGAGLVFLCNPNNPTGTLHGADAVRDCLARITRESPGTIILVDEAYHEYVTDPRYATALPIAQAQANVVVSRTFSKIYGIAGLRVGYAMGQPATIAALRAQALGLNVNQLGAIAAHACLQQPSLVARERDANRRTLEWTRDRFTRLGFASTDSQANFVLVDLGRDAQPFRDACKAEGIAVGRAFPPLLTHVRISIGTRAEMERAMPVFERLLRTA